MKEFRHIRKQIPATKTTIQGPQLSVHYIHPSEGIKARYNWRTLFAIIPVVIALLVGMGFGSASVWQSKFSQAEVDSKVEVKEGEKIGGRVLGDSTTVPQSETENPRSVPIEYNANDLTVIEKFVPEIIEEFRHEPTPEEIANEERKAKLKKYFLSKKSPFGNSDETVQAFLDSKNMRTMIAISFVESTMGQHCYHNNCSGIGGYPPNLRKYDNFAGWVRDFDSLLERRYKGVPLEKFMGVYVQPGSPNWINGVKQTLAELKARGIE